MKVSVSPALVNSQQSILEVSRGVEEFSLENGLKVLIKPTDTSSAVSVWVLYRVGSRNESLGITGASHYCEHMLFKGGGKLGKGDIFKLVSFEGGSNNGFTDKDLTAYFETMPKERLDAGLFIESERMANSEFKEEEVDSERSVVISEREGSENYPMYQIREEMYANAFHVHSYKWPVVGWKSDLKKITREDLFQYYKKYYHPNNAVLVVSGNVGSDLDELKLRINSYFSKIPAGERAPKSVELDEPEQFGERTSKIQRPGVLDYLIMGFRIPAVDHADIPSLIVLSAILGGWQGLIGFFGNRGGFVSRSNRLYKRLVDGRIASEVTLRFPLSIDPDLLTTEVTVIPGSSIQAAQSALVDEFDKIGDSPPSETEMRVAFNQIRSWHAYENDGVTSKALTLGVSEVLGNTGILESLMRSALNVSPEDVREAARKYIRERNRTTCSYESVSQ